MYKPKVRVYNQYTHPIRYTIRELTLTMRNAQEFRNWRTVNACKREIHTLWSKREPIHAV